MTEAVAQAAAPRNKQIAHEMGMLHSCRQRLNDRSNAQAAVKAVMPILISP